MLPLPIIILNYNGWRDTLECLESVLKLAHPSIQVIVVDNGSTDDSVNIIKSWAKGEIQAGCDNTLLKHFTFPPVAKPISTRILEVDGKFEAPIMNQRELIIIRAGVNRGYAAGINIGLKYCLAHLKFEYVWLLNNDTVVTPSALSALVAKMKSDPTAGIVGSTLLYYQKPETIQARAGAHYNKWLALSRHIDVFRPSQSDYRLADIENRLSYVCGASMLVRREFIEQVGLMSEEYFLYFEELDWAVRAEGRFRMAYAPESVVYHKEGGSIGSSSAGAKKSKMADFYSQRNRVLFTKKYYRLALPTLYLGLILSIINRIRRGQWHQALTIARIALHLS